MNNKPYHADLYKRLLAAVEGAGVELTEKHRAALLDNGQFTDDGDVIYDVVATYTRAGIYVTISQNGAIHVLRNGMGSIMTAEEFNNWMANNG